MALRRASTICIPTISTPSTLFKGRLVDTFPFTRKPEYIVTDVKTSAEVENKLMNDLIEKLKQATNPPRCELCNISVTSEEQLKTHLQGKKHKTKKLKKLCKTGVIGFGSKLAVNNSRDEVLKQDGEQSNSRVSINPEEVRDADRASEKVETEGLNYPFWCVVCRVGTCSKEGMDAHLKGKRHISMLSKDIA